MIIINGIRYYIFINLTKTFKMIHEKFIKDERGKIRITVTLVIFNYGGTDNEGNKFRYDIRQSLIPPKKRNEIWSTDICTPEEISFSKKRTLAIN